jgi:hypothetical protein
MGYFSAVSKGQPALQFTRRWLLILREDRMGMVATDGHSTPDIRGC